MSMKCVSCNATEGHYQPDAGWHLCKDCHWVWLENEKVLNSEPIETKTDYCHRMGFDM